MTKHGKIEDLGNDLDSLGKSLGDATSMTAAFNTQLRDVRGSLAVTARDLGAIERGFSSGLKRAFDGAVLDGNRLSDTLRGLAASMSKSVYNAAITPITNHLGAALAGGLNSAAAGMIPFAKGGAFAQGRVMPFAKGGVFDSPVTFPMRGGTGLMGEAGPEAIMPLTRGADGKLGVAAQGGGRAVNITMNISTPDVQGFQRSHGQIAARMSRALSQGQRNR